MGPSGGASASIAGSLGCCIILPTRRRRAVVGLDFGLGAALGGPYLRARRGLMMPPLTKDVIKFGTFTVTSQVFHLTPLSFALVNLKPLLPGHVLVSPRRLVPRFNELSQAEVQDLFQTVQRVSRTVERVFSASALNIAIQDGVDAGQSVPHVHAHIIPRKKDDLSDKGGTDAIYQMMESEEADLGKQFVEHEKQRKEETRTMGNGEARGRFPAVDADEGRKPRSEEEMQKEADWLAAEMAKDDKNGR